MLECGGFLDGSLLLCLADHADRERDQRNDAEEHELDRAAEQTVKKPQALSDKGKDPQYPRAFHVVAEDAYHASNRGEQADRTCPGQNRGDQRQGNKEDEPKRIIRPFALSAMIKDTASRDGNATEHRSREHTETELMQNKQTVRHDLQDQNARALDADKDNKTA